MDGTTVRRSRTLANTRSCANGPGLNSPKGTQIQVFMGATNLVVKVQKERMNPDKLFLSRSL
jgi:hypothetical protein